VQEKFFLYPQKMLQPFPVSPKIRNTWKKIRTAKRFLPARSLSRRLAVCCGSGLRLINKKVFQQIIFGISLK